MSTKHQAFQTAFQYLQQDFVSQRRHFDVFREEYRKHAAQREKLIGHLLMVNEDLRAQSYGRQLYIDCFTKKNLQNNLRIMEDGEEDGGSTANLFSH